ncbi:MAG: cell surface protein SprA [Cytophagales bacterium]
MSFLTLNGFVFAQTDTASSPKPEKYKPSFFPKPTLKDRYGDPYSNKTNKSPMLLKEPSNVTQKVETNETEDGYIIREKIGDLDYRPPTNLSKDQYDRIRKQRDLKEYWRENGQKQDEENPADNNNRRIIPPIYVSPKFDRIFGGNYIDIKPNGNVNLDFGGNWQRIDNPAIPVRQQRSGGFNFNQQIALNIQGKIGEKLKISINQDTKATFEFDNTIKLTYTGMDHDIIKTIEAGNVSMPLSGQLIKGTQSLFGIKTQLQFGRLKVTTILANQRGKSESINVNAGNGPGKPIEIRCTEYEDNRHYFLSQFFREQYESSLANLPAVTSGILINRVEVYVTNLNANPERTKSFVALTDLGEYNPHNPRLNGAFNTDNIINRLPDNDRSNNLYRNFIIGNPAIRNSGTAQDFLQANQFVNEVDYEVINSAKILVRDREFKLNPYLGYISLNTPLQQNEVLAVAFEYTYNGVTYRVGELTGNLPDSSQLVCLKLLRSKSINSRLRLPMWDLMMKNIYSLNVSNLSRKNFNIRVIYKDDATGLDNPSLQVGRRLANKPLVEVLGADQIDLRNERVKDGIFDFVNGFTVDSTMGRIIFPVLEPFGSHIRTFFDPDEQALINDLVFQEIYDTTKAQLIGFPNKAKYFISGTLQSGTSSEIALNGFNIAPGSVRVMSGSQQLTENVDYTVNYDLGRVRIINEGILNSGNKISVSYEKADLFNFRAKSLSGARFDYTVNKDIIVGGTIMHLNERPLITRVAAGDEPIRNTMIGFDLRYKSDSRLLTKAIDKLPLISTKETSNIEFSGEYARLIPGQPRVLGKGGNAFIDDFEGTRIPFDLTRSPSQWKVGSPPVQFRNNAPSEDYRYGANRALLAWYNVDNIFYRQSGSRGTPAGISDDANKHHYTRVVNPQEIFPFRSLRPATINEITFDLAYFPQERGPYNYRTEDLTHQEDFLIQEEILHPSPDPSEPILTLTISTFNLLNFG